MAKILAQVTERDVSYAEAPLAAVRAQSEDLARMWAWFDEVGYSSDLEALRRTYPEVGWHGFSQWAREQDWGVVGSTSREQPTA
jgi:hypothetical protein